jgi:Domain of unknown function (DUF1906)
MSYAGFDRADCPTLDVMQRLKTETNLAWCGFYLPAPSQAGTTWRGKRAPLVAQGWGLAPVYVGQQVTGPGSHLVTAEQGTIDGAHAAQAMSAEGFPQKSWVYLDCEEGPPFTAARRAYLGAWVDAVEVNGFCAGVYCSFLFAAQVAALRPGARIWAFHVKTTSPHLVGGTTFASPDPATSGFPGATIWQHDDEARIMGGLAVDLDSSSVRDPSAPVSTTMVEKATQPAQLPPYVTNVDPLIRTAPVDPTSLYFPQSNKELVAVIQQYLVRHGASLTIDGVWGENTRDAFLQAVA